MTNELLKTFGKHLRFLREEKQLSQEKLADLADLHRTYLGGVERGERNPTLLTLAKIARALDTSLGELVGIDNQGQRPQAKKLHE